MKKLESEYAFALTNAGSEKALKLEVESMGTGWRPGYQRRGFVTFKAASPAKLFSLQPAEAPPASARRFCLSLGKVTARKDAVTMLEETAAAHCSGSPVVMHHVRLTDGRLERVTPAGTSTPDAPAIGQWVGTILELSANEFWAGIHRHAALTSPDPGGSGFLVLPDDAPSRAWLKLEEAVRFFGIRFSPRDIAVELGCAPGGVIHALLQRHVCVIGVDPAKLAPVVMAHAVPAVADAPPDKPWVFHCRKPAALVAKRDLAARVTWFLSDMNQSPAVALKECARFVRMCPSIRSALITLKLTDLTQVVDKPLWFQSLTDMRFRTFRLQQLSVHNRELALLALDRQAAARR
jgi:23S rRNA (cytidine2498-2'-O)-methyltransferase